MEAQASKSPWRHRVLTGSLLLGCCWCVSGLAASSADIGCDNSGHRLQGLRVEVDSLAVQSVDHLPINAEAAPLSPDAAESLAKTAAPILHLAPHIAAILNNVFENSEPGGSPAGEANTSEPPTAGRALQTSDTDEGAIPVNTVIPDDEMARFQRQMYRKDI